MPSCEKYVHVLLLTIIRFFFKGENISPDETGPPAPPPVPETNVRIGNNLLRFIISQIFKVA